MAAQDHKDHKDQQPGTRENLDDKFVAEIAIISPWVPLVRDDGENLGNKTTELIHMGLLNPDLTSYGEQFIVEYLRLIWPYLDALGYKDKKYREPDAPASGAVFFYGCLMYIVNFPNWGQYLSDIVSYNLMYQLVDHYLDDTTMSTQQREIDLNAMKKMLDYPADDYSLCSVEIQELAKVYQQLLQRRPQCKSAIKQLFYSELASVNIQKDPHRTREEYYQLALDKGSKTMEVLGALMEVHTTEEWQAVQGIGHIMQLIDDCMDVFADMEKGIHTTATYDLLHHGNLDNLWRDLVARIGSLPGTVKIFKIIYSIFAVYLPDRVAVFSPELAAVTHPYNWCRFDGSGLLTGSVERVMEELSCGKKSFDIPQHDLSEIINRGVAYVTKIYQHHINTQLNKIPNQ